MTLVKKLLRLKWGQAIVEIILIVTGILIAFQIDRWKESADKREREIKTLMEIKESLKSDQKFLNIMADRYNTVISSLTLLQMHLYTKGAYHDSLQQHAAKLMYAFRFQQRTTAFDNLKIVGIDLITNDSLKTKLVELYDFQYPRQLRIIDVSEPNQNRITGYIRERLTYEYEINHNGELIAHQILKKVAFGEPELLDETSKRLNEVTNVKDRFETIRKSVKGLIEYLDVEIEKKK